MASEAPVDEQADPELAVVTVTWGADAAWSALGDLHRALQREQQPPRELVVVAVQSAALREWEPEGLPVRVLLMSEVPEGLPWGMAKNAGATAALAAGARVLAFVAPDARFEPGTLDAVAKAVRHDPGLRWAARPDARPGDQPDGETGPEDLDEALFALDLEAWTATGGFCEEYAGPGWEDLDLARLAARHGVAMGPVPGATAHRAGGETARGDDAASMERNVDLHTRRWGAPPPARDRGGW